MLAPLRRWLEQLAGLDLKYNAKALDERIARLERLPGPESALAALTKDKGE